MSFTSAKEYFGDTPVSLITAGRVEDFKTWRLTERKRQDEDGEEVTILPVRDITLRHDLHALSKFFGYAIKQRWAVRNPIRDVKIPSDADAVRMHIVTAQEEEQYFSRAATHQDLFDVGRLILNQGPRPEEVTSLRKTDVDLDRGQLTISKGKTKAARRVVTLTTESKVILGRRMAGKSPWVFPSDRKPGEHVSRVNSAHDAVLKKAAKDGLQLDFVLYDLRHTFATRLAQGGIDLATIAAILGHSGLRAVMKYVHPTAEHQKAAMLRYDQTIKLAEITGRPN